MSMVNAYITEHFIVMTGDQRRIHIDDESVYFDDAFKLFQLNDRVTIGLTGDYKVSLDLMEHLKDCVLSTADPSDIERYCTRWIKRQTNAETQLRLLIGGLDDEGKPVIIEITSDNEYKPIVVAAEPGRIEWRLIYANESPLLHIEEELAKLTELSPQTCVELAAAVNERVASVDSFVSPGCNTVVIVAN